MAFKLPVCRCNGVNDVGQVLPIVLSRAKWRLSPRVRVLLQRGRCPAVHNRPMVTSDHWVMVYDYEYWDPASEHMKISATPATLDAIKNGLGIPILASGRKVAADEIDATGRAPVHQRG